MEEKEKKTPIKKVELHRVPVVTYKKTTECIPLPSSELEKISRSCQKKSVERNARHNEGLESAEKFHVGNMHE